MIFALRLWTSVFLILLLSGVLFPSYGAVEIYGDVTVYPAPLPPPAEQQLALAGRLFEAERYVEAIQTVEWLSGGSGPGAAEALLLMGRAAYSDGFARSARRYFEDLVLRFPDSAPLRSGELAGRLSLAATWLLEEGVWSEAGRYVDLLRKIDREKTARLALDLEARVDRELAEYQPMLVRHQFDTADNLRSWLEKRGEKGCTIIKGCPSGDQACRGWTLRLAQKSVRKKNEEERAQWDRQIGEKYDALCLAFAGRAVEDAQRFALLRQLITTGIAKQAILPSPLPGISDPHRYVVRVTDFTKVGGTWALRKDPWKSYKICGEIDKGYVDRLSCPVLRFGPIDRDLVLQRLGELMRGPETEIRVGRRKL